MKFTTSLFALAIVLASGTHAFSGKNCKIMPLGASITYGVGSTDGNGYRAHLYGRLANDGNTVDMVGSQKGGNFSDPDNEGYPGFILSQVDAKAIANTAVYQPNICTLLAGTNDMTGNIDLAGAPGRISQVIGDVLNVWEGLTMVVVATLPPNGNGDANVRIDAFNAALPSVVKSWTDQGRWVVLADIHSVVAVGDLVDGTHPNDAAFERMAAVFYDAIKVGEANGWLP
ncbi:lipolytic enzyme [Auriculariales sp. MPI-PUGE-AT-0066]|nr:lipolytic enzyme [Auriculariales sp. MPI-PUGE-AT-0066]